MSERSKKFFESRELGDSIIVIVGTRPGIIMMAPIVHALTKKGLKNAVVHTGQHYSANMDKALFEDLELEYPKFHLENVANEKTHGAQLAAMIVGCENIFIKEKPKLVIVNGDANTNVAAAIAANKLRIPVAHIEAGERSFDWSMPEEHNRRIMDHISDLLFTTNSFSESQLKNEKVMGKIYVTGNPIVDASINHAELSETKSSILKQYDLAAGEYIVLTSHREQNVDRPERLKVLLTAIDNIVRDHNLKLFFSIHPRTAKRIEEFGLSELLANNERVIMANAVRYLDFMQLLKNSRMVITDSGGVQQEAHIHKKPCVTIRDNTEWPETLQHGWNRIAGMSEIKEILSAVSDALHFSPESQWEPLFGDGRSAQHIADIILQLDKDNALSVESNS